MKKRELLKAANKIASPHELSAEILFGIRSVGVGGDERSYTPVINLRGVFPGYDVLATISNEISNTLGIGRVTFELTMR